MTAITEKTCTKCKRHLPVSSFTRKSAAPNGIDCWCRDCKREYARKYVEKHGRTVYLKRSERYYDDKANNRLGRNHRHPLPYADDPDHLYHHYVVLQKPLSQIGRENNCHSTTIQRRIEQFNIPRQPPRRGGNVRLKAPPSLAKKLGLRVLS